MNCEVGGSERRGARLGCAEGWGGEGSSPSFWPAQGQMLPERQLFKGRAAASSSREPKAFQPTKPGSESWGEMQEETTKFNNSASLVRSGRGQLLPRTAQAQGESPPEPDSIFFKTVLGLEFRLVLHLQSWS